LEKNANIENAIYEQTEIEKTGWKIITVVNIESPIFTSGTPATLLFWGFAVVSVFGLISYIVMDRFVTVPMEKVVEFMNHTRAQKFEKMNLSDPCKNSYLELEVLKETYNQMVDEIELLVDRVHEEERIKRMAELNVLQEQMKPHFLYNTIDAMSYLALSGKNEELYNALEAFGGYYRILLSKGKELISVKEEIEMVRDYLELQKLRYGDSLQYVMDIEIEMENKYVLKMILQPFVENAVNHGIRAKAEGGTVWIKGKEEGGYFCFQVVDNGIGIEQDILKKLQSDILNKNEESFGVRGTVERMKIFYDSDIFYEITSEIEKGTMIHIQVPVIREPMTERR
jgi:two-component system sensor histidine kinase YesM